MGMSIIFIGLSKVHILLREEEAILTKIIKLGGYVSAEGGDMNHSEFLDEFIKFAESRGWAYVGGTTLIDEKREEGKL